ncbi:MAG TPA: hypothetical protein VLJ39_04435 [Tepidisphaeraceae bacterium]|nr:hypothetical protein [Tepidisphaeraceae bacterium]
MSERQDPAAGAAAGQLEAAIALVERIFGQDFEGSNVEAVAARPLRHPGEQRR